MDKLTRENWERIKKHLEEQDTPTTGTTSVLVPYLQDCQTRSNIQRGTFT